MSLQLSTVITGARDLHPAFHRTRVPNAVLARFLTDYQNRLIGKCVERDPAYLAQSAAIALALDDANDPGTVGAGTAGGLPAAIVDEDVAAVHESAGSLLEPLLTTAQSGVILVAERVVTAVVGQVISSTGAGRTTNEDAGRLIHITAGAGIGQVRVVQSNTADSWTPTASWTTAPDTTSMFTIVAANVAADETLGVVTELPALSPRTGYLVRINAQGVPYIDYTAPLTVSLERGVPLPSMLTPVGGTVRHADPEEDHPLWITTYARRFISPRQPAVYFANQQLFLCGSEQDWSDVTGIELQYVPVAPAFTALTDYFLTPDSARPVYVARAAHQMAQRLNSIDGIELDVASFRADADEAEGSYLATLRLQKRGRHSGFRQGAY